jgi:ATPase subunit of ABC transporter with duplicated ATPase domains
LKTDADAAAAKSKADADAAAAKTKENAASAAKSKADTDAAAAKLQADVNAAAAAAKTKEHSEVEALERDRAAAVEAESSRKRSKKRKADSELVPETAGDTRRPLRTRRTPAVSLPSLCTLRNLIALLRMLRRSVKGNLPLQAVRNTGESPGFLSREVCLRRLPSATSTLIEVLVKNNKRCIPISSNYTTELRTVHRT